MRLCCLIALVLSVSLVFAAAPPAKVPAEWLKLIDQLGDEDEDKCKEAEKNLLVFGEDALQALGKAAKSHADPDVRLRALRLVAKIDRMVYLAARRFTGHEQEPHALAVSPDGRRFVSSAVNEGDAYVWEVKTGKLLSRLKGHRLGANGVNGVAWSADGERILTAGHDRKLILWDATTYKIVKTIDTGEAQYAADFTPDGKKAVSCGGGSESVHVWDLKRGEPVATFRESGGSGLTVAVLPGGKQAAVTGPSGKVYLLDIATGKRVRTMDGGVPSSCFHVAASPAGRLLAGCGYDKSIRLWDTATGKLVKELVSKDSRVRWVEFSRDGKRLISAGDGTTATIWDVASGEVVQTLAHEKVVTCAAFLPEGTHAVTGSHDKNLRLWKIRK
jgi:WD40 repeat protein